MASQLPTEILISIFQLVADSPHTLCNLCIASQRFYDIAIPILYTSVTLKRKRLKPAMIPTPSSPDGLSESYTTTPPPLYDDTILSGLVSLALCDQLPPLVKELKIRGITISEEHSYWGSSSDSTSTADNRCRETYASVFEDSGLRELLYMTGWKTDSEKQNAAAREDGYNEAQTLDIYEGMGGRVAFRKDFNLLLTLVLERCEKLRKFKLKSTVEVNDDTISAISKLHLSHLHIAFSSAMAYYWDSGLRLYDEKRGVEVDNFSLYKSPGYTDLSVLHLLNLSPTLTSLKLFDLFGDLYRYIGEIVDVLIACRYNLTELGLSVSLRKRFQQKDDPLVEYAHDEQEDGYEPVGSIGRDRAFWAKVCCRYNRRTRTLRANGEDPRLKLKYLELGLGGFMFNPGAWPFESEKGEYLSEALNLSYLETFYWYTMDDFTSQIGPGWDRLLPAVNLKNIMVDEIHYLPDLFTNLRGKIEYAEVIDDLGLYWEEEDEFNEFYQNILTPALRSCKMKPMTLQDIKRLKMECSNLEVLSTRVWAMKWRETIGHFSTVPKMRNLTIALSLTCDRDTVIGDGWEAGLLKEGLDAVSLIGAIKGYRARGEYPMLEEIMIDIEALVEKDSSKQVSKEVKIRRTGSNDWEEVVC